MCRCISILLTLLIWTTTSGAAMVWHADHSPAHHDESTCQVCATLHAPLSHAVTTTPDITFELHPWQAEAINLVIRPVLLVHTPPCRGPPFC